MAARLLGQGKLSLSEGLLVLRAVAGALYALHQKGLCHGGLHGRNVFLARFEDVTVDGALGGGQGNQRVCLMDDGLKQPAPSGATALLFETTAAFGRMTVLTCGADVAAAGLTRAAVLQRVDEIQGLPSILLRIREVGTKLYI